VKNVDRRNLMKMMIEVKGGMVVNIVATQECSIYLIDHDEIKHGGMLDEGELETALQAQQPDLITWEEGQDMTPTFDNALENSLSDYGELPENEHRYTNHYRCECGHEWQDTWSCMCNDRCPKCNKEIEPYDSDDHGQFS
jgi:hypothetical protein